MIVGVTKRQKKNREQGGEDQESRSGLSPSLAGKNHGVTKKKSVAGKKKIDPLQAAFTEWQIRRAAAGG